MGAIYIIDNLNYVTGEIFKLDLDYVGDIYFRTYNYGDVSIYSKENVDKLNKL